MGKFISSADITWLDFGVLIDMSTSPPTATVSNLSTVVNPANLKWVFEFFSPSVTPIHVGDTTFAVPDIDGVAFTDFDFTEPIPQIFGQMEFSASSAYTVKVWVKDDDGNVFFLQKGNSLCKPNGNNGLNNFGAALISVEARCAQGQLFVTDQTNLLYKSLTGTKVSTTLELDYPTDAAGNKVTIPPVLQIPALFPIYADGPGYEIYAAHIYDYDLGDFFSVRVRYSATEVFPVNCNTNLQPLLCEVSKIAAVLQRTCNDDSAESRKKHQKLNLATVYILEAAVGIIQPLSYKVDMPKKVQAIKDLLQIQCDCTIPAGISNIGTVAFTDAVLSVNKVCGDMLLSWSKDGFGNITLNYQNKSYTFVMSAATGNSAAFSYTQTLAGCNIATALYVDMAVLAAEVLEKITTDGDLLNIFNDMITRSQLVCGGLDGKDVMDLSGCNYDLSLNAKRAGAIIISIMIAGVNHDAPGIGLLLTADTSIETWLNSLALGTFAVNYDSGTKKTTITSASNPNVVVSVDTATSVSDDTVVSVFFNSSCGMICDILQRIIDWGDALSLRQVRIGLDGITVCRFLADGSVHSRSFDGNVTGFDLATYMADSLCNVANYIKDKLVTCTNIKNLFAAHTGDIANPGPADVIPMFQNGICQQVPLKNLALSIFGLLLSDEQVKNIFCQITPCASVNCTEVEITGSTGTDTTWTMTWNAVVNAIHYKWSIDGINWYVTASTVALIGTVGPALVADTAYVFRVFPVYTSGDGSDCEVMQNFSTTNTGDSCPDPADYNLVINNVTDTYFNINWDAIPGVSGYQYRLNGGSWINVSDTTLMVFATGLTPDTTYNIEVRAVIGGTACTEAATESQSTDPAFNTRVTNLVTGLTIEDTTVSGSPYFTISGGDSFPLTSPDQLEGVHGAFSGIISLEVSGATFVACCASLTVNGSLVDSVDIPANTPDDYDFVTTPFLVTDIIYILIQPGTCGA